MFLANFAPRASDAIIGVVTRGLTSIRDLKDVRMLKGALSTEA